MPNVTVRPGTIGTMRLAKIPVERPTANPHEPARHTFHDVVVSPFSELLEASEGRSDHRGGPDWPDWNAQSETRHQRPGRPVDERPAHAPAEQRIEQPIAWGGPIDRHFGHQIADFSMRLISTMADDPAAIVAFASQPRLGWTSMSDTPAWAQEIIDWLGVPKTQRRLITQPSCTSATRCESGLT